MNPALEFIVYMLRAIIFVCAGAFFVYFLVAMLYEHLRDRKQKTDRLMRKGIKSAYKRGWIKCD